MHMRRGVQWPRGQGDESLAVRREEGVEGRLTVSRIPLAVCTVSVTEIATAVEANGNNNDWRFENVHEISNIPFTWFFHFSPPFFVFSHYLILFPSFPFGVSITRHVLPQRRFLKTGEGHTRPGMGDALAVERAVANLNNNVILQLQDATWVSRRRKVAWWRVGGDSSLVGSSSVGPEAMNSNQLCQRRPNRTGYPVAFPFYFVYIFHLFFWEEFLSV